jgi:phosphoenolpyruvate carboxylase
MQGFKSTPYAQRFITTHAAIYKALDFQRHMISRPTLRLFRGAGGFCLGRGGGMSAQARLAPDFAARSQVLSSCALAETL